MKQDRADEVHVETKNRDGKYVQAIPEPYYGLRMRCDCGAKFWKYDTYRGHYALKHILRID